MTQFKKILLIASRKPAAKSLLRRMLHLARANDAAVTLAAPVDWPHDETHLPDTSISPGELKRILLGHHANELQEAVDEVAPDYPNLEIKVLPGKPYAEIIRDVLRHGHDLVVKTAEGKGDVESQLFGTQDMHLMRKCPCPVLIIKPSRRRSFGRVLAAVDVTDEAGLGLNEKILDAAIPAARIEHSTLFVVNAWSYFAEDFLRTKRGYYEEMDELLDEMKEKHHKVVEILLGQLDTTGVSCQTHLLKGAPEDLIPAFARENDIDLIVMGTLSRVGIPGMLIGNTAETILYDTDCSVLTLKPDGFLCPVEL